MAFRIQHTDDIELINTMTAVYGNSGVGKTYLCGTAKDPSKVLILSSEHGTLTLRNKRVAYAEISTMADLAQALKIIANPERPCPFEIICFDSISDFCEMDFREKTVDENGKPKIADKRQAYLEVAEDMRYILRKLRDLKKDVICIFKQGRVANQFNVTEFSPLIPGSKAAQDIPYFFDEVFALRIVKDAEGNFERQLVCQPDGEYIAKDRSGMLDPVEPADLGYILDKIKGKKQVNQANQAGQVNQVKIGSDSVPSFLDMTEEVPDDLGSLDEEREASNG